MGALQLRHRLSSSSRGLPSSGLVRRDISLKRRVGFLVLAEAMSVTGISLALASVFLPLAHTKSVAYVSGFATVLVCNPNESLID